MKDRFSTINEELAGKLESYFGKPQFTLKWALRPTHRNPRKLKERYKKYASDNHAEQWMTLIALWGLLGYDPRTASADQISALNDLLRLMFSARNGSPEPPHFESLHGTWVELALDENSLYKKHLLTHLKALLSHGLPSHPYHDRDRMARNKLSRRQEGFEGNTNLDVLISGSTESNQTLYVAIEAKFQSDISTGIRYNPVRNQIARSIDCGLHLATYKGKRLEDLNNFWFVLLTPGMFRTTEFGGSSAHPSSDTYSPAHGRFYCYVMNSYLNPEHLREDLPHWNTILNDQQWKLVSDHIGWLTFEDIVNAVTTSKLLPRDELHEFRTFFSQRGIVPRQCKKKSQTVHPLVNQPFYKPF